MTDTAAPPQTAGFPGGSYPTPRRMGQFPTLRVGGFEVVPEDQLATTRYFGLHSTDYGFDAYLTTASGRFILIFQNVRSVDDGTLYARTPLAGAMQSSPDGLTHDAAFPLWEGPVLQEIAADGRIRFSAPGDAGPECSYDADALEWKTGDGQFHVSGPAAGGGTQWYQAWRQPTGETGELLMCHHCYAVEGTYLGEAVTGHVIVEAQWGNRYYEDTWWVANRVGHWVHFVNNYDDGTAEHGQFLLGEYGARGAIVVDDAGREVLNTTNISAVERADGGIDYEFGNGERWECVGDPTRSTTFPRTRLMVGEVRRKEDRRTIVRSVSCGMVVDHIPEPVPFQ